MIYTTRSRLILVMRLSPSLVSRPVAFRATAIEMHRVSNKREVVKHKLKLRIAHFFTARNQ